MERLKQNELIFGRLLPIDEPHLIERYNRALSAFGVPNTRLERFEIDRTGFSPQIAEEIGDFSYLDPNGINRRFIILTPDQAELPVVHTAFSNTSQLMYEFFAGNQRAINAVTIKDVIYGEIEDSVSKVKTIEDLLSINQVEFRTLSAEDTLGKEAELRTLVDRLNNEADAWRDNEMLHHMVELAKSTGDIRQNTLVPDQLIFRHDAYWTSHFGGLYVFIDDNMTTVITDPEAPGFRRSRPWQVSYLSIRDPEAVFRFLLDTERLELPRGSWVEGSKYFEHRAEMAIRALIHKLDPDQDLNRIDAIWTQTWIHRNADHINRDGIFPFLNAAKREIARTGQLDLRHVDPAWWFLVVRGNPAHEDAWLTNRLISEFVPQDFLSKYIFNKQGFYADYEACEEKYRDHVVHNIKSTYLNNKRELREQLYGLKD